LTQGPGQSEAVIAFDRDETSFNHDVFLSLCFPNAQATPPHAAAGQAGVHDWPQRFSSPLVPAPPGTWFQARPDRHLAARTKPGVGQDELVRPAVSSHRLGTVSAEFGISRDFEPAGIQAEWAMRAQGPPRESNRHASGHKFDKNDLSRTLGVLAAAKSRTVRAAAGTKKKTARRAFPLLGGGNAHFDKFFHDCGEHGVLCAESRKTDTRQPRPALSKPAQHRKVITVWKGAPEKSRADIPCARPMGLQGLKELVTLRAVHSNPQHPEPP
jgi:hypothetical protein